MLGYIPSIATVLLALLQLGKDWGAHQTHWRRALVLLAIMLLGVGGAINTYFSSKKAAAQHAEDENKITGLQKSVETANKDQQTNTKIFVDSFRGLSDKLGGLKVQLKTVGLQKEAERLKQELEATQKALSPPQAELEASVGDVTETLENLDVKEKLAQVSLDGSVAFTITVANKSNVQAKNGSIYLRICQGCEFAEEPKRFSRPLTSPAYDREMLFQAINAIEAVGIDLKIKPPPGIRRFEVDVTTRCENCTFRPKDALYVRY